MRDSRGFSCRRAAAGTDHCLHFRQSRCGTAHCRHHQAAGCFARLLQPSPTIIIVRRRQLRQATATIARRRQLPSETFRFAPSRRLSLRSFRVLATLSLAPALHAVPSRHPFTWPWAAMGFARAQPAACRANITHRLLTGNTHDLTPPQPFYQLISIGTSGCIHVDGIGGWQSPKGIRCSLRGTRQPPYLSGVVQPFPDVTDQELKVHGRPFFILM